MLITPLLVPVEIHGLLRKEFRRRKTTLKQIAAVVCFFVLPFFLRDHCQLSRKKRGKRWQLVPDLHTKKKRHPSPTAAASGVVDSVLFSKYRGTVFSGLGTGQQQATRSTFGEAVVCSPETPLQLPFALHRGRHRWNGQGEIREGDAPRFFALRTSGCTSHQARDEEWG